MLKASEDLAKRPSNLLDSNFSLDTCISPKLVFCVCCHFVSDILNLTALPHLDDVPILMIHFIFES